MSLYNNLINSVNYINVNSTISNLNVTNGSLPNLNFVNITMSTLVADGVTTSSLNVSGFNSVQPFIIVYAATAQSIPNSTITQLSTYYSGASTSSGISQASGVFTVTYGGLYFISAGFGFAGSTSGRRNSWVTKNNSAVDAQRFGSLTGPGTSSDYYISTMMQLDAGDNVRVMVFQNSGGALTGQTGYGEKFSMVKVA